MSRKSKALAKLETVKAYKLDFGCGPRPKDGFEGIDAIDFGQKYVMNLVAPRVYKGDGVPTGWAGMPPAIEPWPWEDDSVLEAHASHFVEHLDGTERVAFFNELYRVLMPKSTALIVTPNWSHSCAYGDPTHKWPPMSGWYPLYLNKNWRKDNAPHCGYTCDFDFVIGGAWDERHNLRNAEFKTFAMNSYTDSLRELIVTLTKKVPDA